MSVTPGEFHTFLRLVVRGDCHAVSRRLDADPSLATMAAATGATRQTAEPFFFTGINHYVYAGDTALHLAAAAFQTPIARLLVKRGADCSARNRRGAQPLHYAADTNHWNPKTQAATIRYLVSLGADPNATDRSGVTPLHRAVRTRSAPAVRALLAAGADPNFTNRHASSPMQLARQRTGRGGSGSRHALRQQAQIIALLLKHGATADKTR